MAKSYTSTFGGIEYTGTNPLDPNTNTNGTIPKTRSDLGNLKTEVSLLDKHPRLNKTVKFSLVDNWIYFYHLRDSSGNQGVTMYLPTQPLTFTESLSSSFATTNALARSAPIYTYQYSGPRSIQLQLNFHRDIMDQLNLKVSNAPVNIGEDYTDTLINYMQAVALPTYSVNNKAVNPPIVAIKFGNAMFIKGVVNGGISTTHSLPILADTGKYAQVSVSFTISEVDPYDAETAVNKGSLRGLSTFLGTSNFKQWW